MIKQYKLPDRKDCPGGKCPKCGSDHGDITTTNSQDVVRCRDCGKYLYNAPKTETGRAVRSVSTTHAAIKPKQRARIIERANRRCEVCGNFGNMHVGHIVSVAYGHRNGLSDAVLNSDENLICQCEECNLGASSRTIPLRMYVAILVARLEVQSE